MSKRIAILVEGATEKAFKPILLNFLEKHLSGRMPKLIFHSSRGLLPRGNGLRDMVETLFEAKEADMVIALTDVYTGEPEFKDAKDAKEKMRAWVGDEPRFHPHAAQHDFEAWLLPFWKTIQRLAGSNRSAPGVNPEQVNHGKPPAYYLAEIFRIGRKMNYIKPSVAKCILEKNDLAVAAKACPELQAFLNTILNLYDLEIADGQVKKRTQ